MKMTLESVLNEDSQGALPTEQKSQAQLRYELQLEIVERLERKWRAAKCPVLAKGGATGKANVPHPLATMLQAALVTLSKLERDLAESSGARSRGGRPKGASSAPDRKGPPPKLRLISEDVA